MELAEVVRRRRMVRRFDPDRPVPAESLDRVLASALRAPSAGYSQGFDFLVLTDPADRAAYWAATTDDGSEPDSQDAGQAGQVRRSWLAGVRAAPVLVVCCSDKEAYLRRYAEPDKGWTDRDEARWPVPYWDIDTGMAALLMLLTAVDEGLGALFFGIPPEYHDDVHEHFAIPRDRTLVGVVALGYPAPSAGSGTARRKRPADEALHFGRFGRHRPGA